MRAFSYGRPDLLGLSLFLGVILVSAGLPHPVSGNNHECCSDPGLTGGACRKLCNSALSGEGNITFQLGLLQSPDCSAANVRQIFKCAASYVPRDEYMTMFIDPTVKDSYLQSVHLLRAIKLSLACLDVARTDRCRNGLRNLVAGIPGTVNGTLTVEGEGISIMSSFFAVALDCLAAGDPSSAEWDGGMSSCAGASLQSRTPTFTSKLAKVATNSECNAECLPKRGNLPFCAAHFSTADKKQYGARCLSRDATTTADSVAKATYTSWISDGVVRLGSATLNITVGVSDRQRCMALLRASSCRATLSPCSAQNMAGKPWCADTCASAFTSSCGASATDAQAICSALQASGSSGSTSCEDPSPVPQHDNYQLATRKGETRNHLNGSICLSSGNLELVDLALSFVLLTTCKTLLFQCYGGINPTTKSGNCTNHDLSASGTNNLDEGTIKFGLTQVIGGKASEIKATVSEVSKTVVAVKAAENGSPAERCLPSLNVVVVASLAILLTSAVNPIFFV